MTDPILPWTVIADIVLRRTPRTDRYAIAVLGGPGSGKTFVTAKADALVGSLHEHLCVVDSDAEKEYEETQNKAGALLAVLHADSVLK